MCSDKKLFSRIENLGRSQEVALEDGHVLQACERGIVTLEMKLPDGKSRRCDLQDVLGLSYNLLSVPKATKAGKVIEFDDTHGRIIGKDGKLSAVATRIGSLYHVDCRSHGGKQHVNAAIKESRNSLWHRRFGHLGMQNLQKLTREKMVDGLDCDVSDDIGICEACIGGKLHKRPFPVSSEIRSENPLDLVHSDVCGKLGTKSFGGD